MYVPLVRAAARPWLLLLSARGETTTRCVAEGIPDGFVRLDLPPSGFIDGNGPLYGKPSEDRFVLGFRVEQRHCNPQGHCHGGMLATFADMLLARGSSVQGGLSSFLMTVHLSCDYLDIVAVGTWIEGRVDILRMTRSLVFTQGVVTASDRPVLRANAILKRPPTTPDNEKHAGHGDRTIP